MRTAKTRACRIPWDSNGPQNREAKGDSSLFLFRSCFGNHVRARRIGANPEKSDLVNFRGPD